MSPDIDTRFAYRNLGVAWLVVVLVVPLVLAAALAVVRGDKIEDNLQVRSLAALSSAGLSAAGVAFDGRDATINTPTDSALTPAALDRARDVVAGVDGVRAADLDSGSGTGNGTGWLIGQLWLLLLLSFLGGSVLTWLVARFLLPNEDLLEADTGVVSEGLL